MEIHLSIAFAQRQVWHVQNRIESFGKITEIYAPGFAVTVVEQDIAFPEMVQSETVMTCMTELVIVLVRVVGGDKTRWTVIRFLVAAVRILRDDGEVSAGVFPEGVVVGTPFPVPPLRIGPLPVIRDIGIRRRTDPDMFPPDNPLRKIVQIRKTRHPVRIRRAVRIVDRQLRTVQPAVKIVDVLRINKTDLLELNPYS